SLIMGSPAKVIKTLTEEEVEGLVKHAALYIGFKNDYQHS
ncbi:MAG: carbonic anhydrase/acetyltransferase-like protein (isoleucine patch superfamily), partial [Arcobacteraceae bacterium]